MKDRLLLKSANRSFSRIVLLDKCRNCDFVWIDRNCIIGHDCVIGNFCHIGVNVCIGGATEVGDNTVIHSVQ